MGFIMTNFKNKSILFVLLCSGMCVLSGAYANSSKKRDTLFRISGTTLATIDIQSKKNKAKKEKKTIGLLKIIPSEKFIKSKKNILKNAKLDEKERDYSFGIVPFHESPGAVDLGMNSVPVFDQGAYGTCVTFAATAAVDAILGKKDLISQQCILELNRMLGHNLWNGAYYASEVLNPLKKYGIIKQGKGKVEEGKCNSNYPNVFGLITIFDYKARSSKSGASASKIKSRYISSISLSDIKTALDAKHRIALGFGMAANQDSTSVQGFNMKIGDSHTVGGLWACQQPGSSQFYCKTPNSGHEVVVIGYDDKQKLIKIRNSWDRSVGEEGNFYMTYTFLEAMSFDGTEIY